MCLDTCCISPSVALLLMGALLSTISPCHSNTALHQPSSHRQAEWSVSSFMFLTWLPSFCQNTAGGGFPLVPQRKVTVRPGAVIWSRGRTTICGGTATRQHRGTISRSQQKCIYICVSAETRHQWCRKLSICNYFLHPTHKLAHRLLKTQTIRCGNICDDCKHWGTNSSAFPH